MSVAKEHNLDDPTISGITMTIESSLTSPVPFIHDLLRASVSSLHRPCVLTSPNGSPSA